MALSARRRLARAQSAAEARGGASYPDFDAQVAEVVLGGGRRALPAAASLVSTLPGQRRPRLAFASVSADAMAPSACPAEQQPKRRQRRARRGEQFQLASAAEVTVVPGWRLALGNIAAGATAGATVEAALYPIDTIKTRLQATLGGGGVRALLQSGGGKALYAGIWGNLVGVVPASAIFMGVYEPVKQRIAASVPENRNYLSALGGGAVAGLAASFVRVPTEVVKQRLQTGEFAGALQAVASITRVEGVRGMFAGYGSFLLRDLPFDALEFFAYEQLKRSYKARLPVAREPNSLETSAIGAIAGAFTGVATTPLDVIKTRLMTQGTSRTYSGVLDCAQKIWAQEGSAAFLKGWQPRVIWIGLGGCVFFTALEEAKKLYLPKGAVLPAGH